jgi:aspartyl-tRNA synthetase
MKRTLAKDLHTLVGQNVKIMGWLNAKRNHGKIAFLDIRDRTGITQCVLLPGHKDYAVLEKASVESVVAITGMVVARPGKMVNTEIVSGNIELQIENLEVISPAKTLPFELDETIKVNEELRLEYRYLDLRTKRMKDNLKLRSKAIGYIMNYLLKNDFTYIQTPVLTKSTPEGARDYLVPSRIYPEKFFALPQSPQQYKQLLMVSGIERYFQIAPCFRDEDARADRSPGEFYQIDMEMSYVDQDDILKLTEEMFTGMIKELLPEKKFTLTPWPRLTYSEVMSRYGSDKPDLRKDKNDPNELAFLWVVDFPLFVKQSQDDFFHGSGKSNLAPSHHMFTAPKKEDIELLSTKPEDVHSYQHDLVLNGLEVGGGSIRIHQKEIQERVWNIIGFSREQKDQFNHLMRAFDYGVPPHGGIAPGFDRLISILANEQNIREVIAFPLNGEARDPLLSSPAKVTNDQLKEVHIKTIS